MMVSALAAQAQEMYLGGGISLWRNDDTERTKFSISPDFGYNFNSRWAVGAELVFSHESGERITAVTPLRWHRMPAIHSMKTRLSVCSSTWDWVSLLPR